MAEPSKHRTLALIGGGVGLATASVITLLVLEKPPEEQPTQLAERAAAVPALPSQAIAGGAVKPWKAPELTAEAKAELAAAATAEQAERTKEEAAAKTALAQAARADAIEQARTLGILGTTTQSGAFASLTGTGDISSGFDDTNIYGGLGTIGTGQGGGGTGWGTIGTGRYGTIGSGGGGSGYGVGSGRGRMRGRAATGPTLSIGQPSVAAASGDGELDKAIIRRYVKRNFQKLQYCYEKELLAKPTLAGTIVARFTITDAGAVAGASASGVDPEVSRCMTQVIAGIEFPRPKGTGGVAVTYPLTARPATQP